MLLLERKQRRKEYFKMGLWTGGRLSFANKEKHFSEIVEILSTQFDPNLMEMFTSEHME